MASGIRFAGAGAACGRERMISDTSALSSLTASGWYRGGSRRHQTGRPAGVAHQARTRSSPAATFSQLAADASPATTARCPLASTRRPNSPCSRSPKASTQRNRTPSGTSEGGSPSRYSRPDSRRAASSMLPAERDARHPRVGHGRRQLEVAEVVDPGDLGPQAGPAVVQSALLDDAAGEAHQRRRVDGLPQILGGRARAQRRRRGGEEVAPVEGGAAVRGRRLVPAQLDHAGDRRLAGRLRRRDQEPVVGPDEAQGARRTRAARTSMAMPRRDVPTPGSTTPSTTPAAEMRHGTHQGVAPGADVEGRHVVREVDDRRPRGTTLRSPRAPRRRTRPGSRSRRGRRRSGRVRSARAPGSLSAASCASVPWRRPPPP